MNQRTIVGTLLDWYAKNARDLPWRRTRDPYAIWISEIMLQQTQVATVIPYWERWMQQLPTIATLAKARPSKVHKLWEGLGYYSRVRNLHRAAKVLVKQHDSKVPEDFETILQLPGIGRYSAGAISSIAFNQPRPILDGNVIRVLTRLFGIEGNPRESETNKRLWTLAEDLVRTAVKFPAQRQAINLTKPPREQARAKLNGAGTHRHVQTRFLAADCNQALMELGALICTSRQPECSVCPCTRFCRARLEDRVHELPALGPRPAITNRRFIAFAFESGGRFLVRQRPKGTVNAFLWEFPNLEVTSKDADWHRAAQKALGAGLLLRPFCSIRHSITRFRITLDVFRAPVQSTKQPTLRFGGRWLTCAQLERLPFTSAHKKILKKLHTSPAGSSVL